MKEDLIDEILDAIVPALETSQAQSAALFQILQQKKVFSNEEYRRLVEQASNAADIKRLPAAPQAGSDFGDRRARKSERIKSTREGGPRRKADGRP